MTVGEPEINLNTWGLRYVRKKDSPFGDTTAVLGDRNPAPEGKGDFKHSEYSGGKGAPYKDSKTETLAQPRPDEEQVSSHSPSRANEANSGSTQTTGGTQATSTAKPFGEERSLTSRGRLSTSGAPKHGEEKLQTGKPQHPLAGKERDSSGNPWKKVTQEGGSTPSSKPAKKNPERKGGQVKPEHAPSSKPESATSVPKKNPERQGGEVKPEHAPSAKPVSITRAALDLAIIKCKLLKAKDITATHGYGSSSRYGSDNTGSANIVDAERKETKAPVKDGKTETLSTRTDDIEVTSYGEGATGTHGNDSPALKPTGERRDVKEEGKGVGHGDNSPNTIINRSEDEIVSKAIELINQAYSGLEKKGEWDNVVKPSKRGTEKPFGQILDEDGRPDEYSKEEHAEHNSNKD